MNGLHVVFQDRGCVIHYNKFWSSLMVQKLEYLDPKIQISIYFYLFKNTKKIHDKSLNDFIFK